MIYWNIKILEYWDNGILRYWNIEILEYWNIKIFIYWDIEILWYWDIHISGYCDIRILSYLDIEISEYWDSGILRYRNIEILEIELFKEIICNSVPVVRLSILFYEGSDQIFRPFHRQSWRLNDETYKRVSRTLGHL